jgi:hypothetical protein
LSEPEWLGAFEVLEVLAGSLPRSAPDGGTFPEGSIDLGDQFHMEDVSECETEVEMPSEDDAVDPISPVTEVGGG